MSEFVKIIVKCHEYEYGHLETIRNNLPNWQYLVGGYINIIPIRPGISMVVNKDGKAIPLPPNILWDGDVIVGTIAVVGDDGNGVFSDCPITMEEWADLLREHATAEGTGSWQYGDPSSVLTETRGK